MRGSSRARSGTTVPPADATAGGVTQGEGGRRSASSAMQGGGALPTASSVMQGGGALPTASSVIQGGGALPTVNVGTTGVVASRVRS